MRYYLVVLSAVFISGCSFGPKVPLKVPGTNRVSINNPAVVADTMGQFFAAQKRASSKADQKSVISLSTAMALESRVPDEFRVFVDAHVDLQAQLGYDSSKPWAEALGDALIEVDVEMAADLEKKLMTLKPAKLSVGQVINKYVPPDYSVISDDSVNLEHLVSYDRRAGWSEAVGKALAAAGIHSTTNFNQKLVVLYASPAHSLPHQISNRAAISNPTTKKND